MRRDIERSVAADITDVLKKNSGVEVVQYSGVLSGIGIRGFRPETSGLNKRSLLLIDGRPSGVTNLSTLMLDGVERIEVLKGPASSIYGASAMGGVVNVITRRSRGPVDWRRPHRASAATTRPSLAATREAAWDRASISTSTARRSTSVTTSAWATGS